MPCLLTKTTVCATLKHKAVRDRAVSAQVQEVPLAANNRRDVSGNDKQVVAQMKCGQTSFKLSARQDCHLKTVNCEEKEARQKVRERDTKRDPPIHRTLLAGVFFLNVLCFWAKFCFWSYLKKHSNKLNVCKLTKLRLMIMNQRVHVFMINLHTTYHKS